MIVLELDELGAGVEVRLAPEQGQLLARSGVVSATPSPYRAGFWRVTPAGLVGAAAIGATEIYIRPKVAVSRLLFLVGYAQHGAAWQTEPIHVPEAADLIPAIAQTLWRLTRQAIHQGLLPGYIVVEESSPVLRGRLREAEQLHRHHGLPLPLEIRHDEFTTDIAENRILRTACERMLTVPGVDAHSQRMLRRLLRDFADVSTIPPGDPVPHWQASRLNARYHAALRLSDVILRAGSVEHGTGGVVVSGFLLNMPKLFEDFLAAALRKTLMTSYGGRVDDQDPSPFDIAGRVTLRPDIVWKIRGKAVAVIDAKYKAEKPAGYPNADLYQLLAYCTVLGLDTGHLVYARGSQQPAHHIIRRSGIEILCHAIDLAADPEALLSQMHELARRIAELAAVAEEARATIANHLTGASSSSGWSW